MASTYTFTKKTPAKDSTGASHYATQPVDGSHIPMQVDGNGFQTSDASSTAKLSGLSLSTTTTELLTPESAVQLTMSCNVAFTFSEINSTTQVFAVPANTLVTLDVANCEDIYVASAGTSPVLSFYYTIV